MKKRGHHRTHRLMLTVVFDKPCTVTHAAKEAADCIHGDFYPTALSTDQPGKMRVRSITREAGRTGPK